MLIALKDALHSLTKALDILYVKESQKPVARIIGSNDAFLDLLDRMDLQYVLSDFKVVSVKNETGSYTDRGL
ncbi:hypothetical protein GOV09_06805, partial [Candidatus Woesearchaeota archaeon]|nr:hypothetical protein [Candidatus Woesearchaeota archaeon]